MPALTPIRYSGSPAAGSPSVFAVERDGTPHFTITTVDEAGKPVTFAEYRGRRR